MRFFVGEIGLGFGHPPVAAELPDEVTPTGNMGKAMVNLRNLVAESAMFQDAIGAAGSEAEKIAQAKGYLHMVSYDPEVEGDSGFERPFGLICHVGNDKSEAFATGDSLEFQSTGDLELWFEHQIPVDYQSDPDNAELYFQNFYEGVMADCMDLSGNPGYFCMNSWAIKKGPAIFEPASSQHHVYFVKISITWGLAA